MSFLFTLQKYAGIGSRYACPACGKPREFVRYVDAEGEPLGDHVGRCNREVECSYHFTPSDYLKENPSSKLFENVPLRKEERSPCISKQKTQTAPSFISEFYLQRSIDSKYHDGNHFIQYLKKVVGTKYEGLIKRFSIGSATMWPGAVVFWQIDANNQIRSGKIIDYNPSTGKRKKNCITWVHSELQKKNLIKDFHLQQCLFGENQLIKEPSRPVGIVESEKTAIIATAYLPNLTWMACGSLTGISPERFRPIQNNSIILYPDIKGFEKWNAKAHELRKKGFRVTVSDLLENAPFVSQQERDAGFDLADYLPRLSIPLTAMERMEARNPQLKELAKRFDLIENR
jgi:Domain of unknown function (DUF6371)